MRSSIPDTAKATPLARHNTPTVWSRRFPSFFLSEGNLLFVLPLLWMLLLLIGAPLAGVAQKKSGGNPLGVRLIGFRQEWIAVMPPGTKLFDIGRVKQDQNPYLVTMSTTTTLNDPRRTLSVLRWNGSRFISESGLEMTGSLVDVLLVGNYRTLGTAPVGNGDKTRTRGFVRNTQVIASEAIYEWNGKDFERISAAPIGLKGEIVGGRRLSGLLAGAGDQTTTYEFAGNEIRVAKDFILPLEEDSFLKFAIGSQDYPGSEALRLGAGTRYIQSHWRGQNHWMMGIAVGRSLPTQEDPKATIGDRLVVYAPRQGAADRAFWASPFGDFEEVWRSEALPGKILDVRVGDPRNDGKDGIMVLVSENEGKDRKLYFFGKIGI